MTRPIDTTVTSNRKNRTIYSHRSNAVEMTSIDMMNTISRRIEMISDLNLTAHRSTTEYRIRLQGLGSMVESHDDAYLVEGSRKTLHKKFHMKYLYGDNIATILIWLTDVEGGGGTFFSSNGSEQVVMPTRGSALIWVNLKSSGDACLLQTHGGCPVSKGMKLVLGTWVNHYNQWRYFPCQLEENQKIKLRFPYGN